MGRERPNILTLPARLASAAGPIFIKEIRSDSRRMRLYLLRTAYVVLLALFVASAWLAATQWNTGESNAYLISRMPEAGKRIVSTIVWFQFVTVQLTAIVLLSTSISGEIYHRTLAVLMTTPLTSSQIVVGKLLSRLVPLAGLLAVSLPLMSIVRVFGGVPWSFVISGVAVTFSATLFIGSVTMFFSVLFRRAYATILMTLSAAFVFYFVLPGLFGIIVLIISLTSGSLPEAVFIHLHPLAAMIGCTYELFSPGSGPGASFLWPLHSLFMLLPTALVLHMTISLLRKVALRRAVAGVGVVASFPPAAPPVRPPTTVPAGPAFPPPPLPRTTIREIKGSPLLWREIRSTLFRDRGTRLAVGLVFSVVLGATYLVCGMAGVFTRGETHGAYAYFYVMVGALATAILAASSIASEKESRQLPVLLSTPLTDAHVVLAKAAGTLRRCAPIWCFLFGHVLLFTVAGCIHPLAIVYLVMLVTWVTVFLTGTGLYFSTACRRVTTAVIVNCGMALALWVVAPVFIVLLGTHSPIFRGHCLSLSPVTQAWVLLAGSGASGNLQFNWPGESQSHSYYGLYRVDVDADATTLRMLVYTTGYCAVGAAFAWRAVRRLRSSIF